MKITKYPQSNFLIEAGGRRILIDPGFLTFKKYSLDDFGNIDAVLITHQHPDHLETSEVSKLIEKGIPVYGNADVFSVFQKKGLKINKVENGTEFEVGSAKIQPIDITHFKNLWCNECNDKITPKTINNEKRCKLHPQSKPKRIDGPPNTGFIFNNIFFHPGDGIKIDNLTIKTSSIPIGGPTVEYEHAWNLAKLLQAKTIIPMHYSIPAFGAIPQEFAKEGKGDAEVTILEDGQSTEI